MTSYVVMAHYGTGTSVCLGTFMNLEKAKKAANDEAERAHEIYGKAKFVASTATGGRRHFALENTNGEDIAVYSVPHDAYQPPSHDDGY